jgi:hypothetical protein
VPLVFLTALLLLNLFITHRSLDKAFLGKCWCDRNKPNFQVTFR